MSKRVVVVDYGVGNLHSVTKALLHQGATVSVTADGEEIERASHVVLPGVGAFEDCRREFHARGLAAPITRYIAAGRPLLGICVGAQLLMSESEEFGRHEGLGVIPGRVVRIPSAGVKVPHVGWNSLRPPSGTFERTILESVGASDMVYFVHSYAPVPEDPAHWLAETRYGTIRFASAIRRDNALGVQFHPEKSGETGLRIIASFLAL